MSEPATTVTPASLAALGAGQITFVVATMLASGLATGSVTASTTNGSACAACVP